jgi:hypothetical protein
MANKNEYCVGCDHLKMAGNYCGCYIGYNTPAMCPIAKRNKQIADFEMAKAELKAEIEKPFIKFLDWLENKLQRIEKWWHNG